MDSWETVELHRARDVLLKVLLLGALKAGIERLFGSGARFTYSSLDIRLEVLLSGLRGGAGSQSEPDLLSIVP